MTNSKWIRRALLGGVAMTVMAAGAQADDLSALKAQIEALQARVNTIETRGATLPEGVSFLTVARGHKAIAMTNEPSEGLDATPESRGMTIAVTPTADLPAPATEITISGYVRAIAMYSHDNPATGSSDNDFDLGARGQVDIKSKTDTAVGQVRTHIRLRGNAAVTDGHDHGTVHSHDHGVAGASPYNGAEVDMHLYYGEWDFMPNWTLKAGMAGQIYAVPYVAYASVGGVYGVDSSRHAQIGLHYNGGPVSFGFGIEDPSYADPGSTATMPDFGAYAKFSMGGVKFGASAGVGKVDKGTGNKTGYIFGVGAAFNAGMFGVNAGFAYGKGMIDDIVAGTGPTNNGAALHKAWGVQGNATMGLNEATTLYIGAGYYNYTTTVAATDYDHGFNVIGGVAWKPVSALQVAAEAGYSVDKLQGGGKDKGAYGALGFWFFF